MTWEHPATDDRPGREGALVRRRPDARHAAQGVQPRGRCGQGHPLHRRQGLAAGRLRLPHRGSQERHDQLRRARPPEDLIPPSLGHHQEWIHACKTGAPTTCNFDYSGALIEHNLLGAVAFRTGKKLEWDADKLQATNCPEAEQFVKKTYRDGWVLNG